MENETKNASPMMIPAAIIVAGVLIAGAVMYSSNPRSGGGKTAEISGETKGSLPSAPSSAENVRAVDASDHIRGDSSAKVMVVEFSDLECPFCKRFHETMQEVIKSYGGKVAWVYRHFPLDNLHSKARNEAEASECASELGGNDAFWKFVDGVFEVTPSNNGLDPSELGKIAGSLGLDSGKFEECRASGRSKAHIQRDLEDAVNSGGQGTPHTIVIAKNGKKFLIPGAQSLAAVKQILDAALAE
ncbi:MAG: thioredoxin domain-containing protein [Candidatus Spechtbacteria bacterium]|nr:thioredoxin domain-containing protein [Candidatus Spechtbacteria bacterium]